MPKKRRSNCSNKVFIVISLAYKVLGNPANREAYDKYNKDLIKKEALMAKANQIPNK